MVMNETSYSSSWTREQDKAFEAALADHPDGPDEQAWDKIAADVPGKTMDELRRHYELLVEDVNSIASGHVPVPCYTSDSEGGSGKKGANAHADSAGKGSKLDQERRKGIAWTEDEHRLFLLGLDKYGKGDWRSISRNFVVSRTPTQVASHAQKYFIRLNSLNKERRRTSIHDITSVGNGEISASQVPITGQGNGPVGTGGKSSKQSPQPSGGPPSMSMYGTTIGQPVGGPLNPALDTPVNLPVPIPPHTTYGVQTPVSGAVVAGAVNMPPVTYPMPATSSTI